MNLAETVRAWLIVTVQLVVVPVQAPDQPANTDPAEGDSVSVTIVPDVKSAEQVAPQSIPGGLETIEPAPAPRLDTVRR